MGVSIDRGYDIFDCAEQGYDSSPRSHRRVAWEANKQTLDFGKAKIDKATMIDLTNQFFPVKASVKSYHHPVRQIDEDGMSQPAILILMNEDGCATERKQIDEDGCATE